MNSRDRVAAVFDHQEPDCVPAWFGAAPETRMLLMNHLELGSDEELSEYLGDDFRRVYARFNGPVEFGPFTNLQRGSTFRTPFGIERYGYGYGMPRSTPLKETTLTQAHDYPWPDPDWMDPSNIKKDASKWHDQHAILGGDWSPFWHDAIDLLGWEGLFYQMYDAPEIVDAVFEHLVSYYIAVNTRIFDAAADVIDIFFIGNDFGTQNGPMLGEDMFTRFVSPHLQRLTDLGHDYGLKVMMHCCGGFESLIPAMIDAGVDGLQALQPAARNMEPEKLKRLYGDKIVFNGCIDSQKVLVEGSVESVRQNIREVLKVMKPGGGYIASPSHDYVLPETPVENIIAMFESVREFGIYA